MAEHIDALREATAGHELRIKVTVEFGEAGKVPDDVVNQVNGILRSVRPGWRLE